MAKFVCDTDEVSTIGDNISKAASDISAAIKNYSNNSENALSGWDGVAKKSFLTANNEHVKVANSDSEFIDALGKFVKESAQAIDELEGELSNLKI